MGFPDMEAGRDFLAKRKRGEGARAGGGSGAGAAVAMAAAATATSPADKERYICIYPAYLNNKKTIAEGRRIPIDKAVENPTSTEIQDVCAAVGFNVLLEKNKMYPREWNRDVQYRGRVRIQLKQDDGNPCLPQFPTRKSVMLYAAETIPKLKTRTQKMGGSDQSLQQGEGGKKGKGKKKK
ncbi:signal recognition particle 19 kDa protein [Falco naumanni]|uniref:signal recognition particle 19 kDa protein n=2 Tax=Falco TaxID=8952 RepID=UPI001ADE6B2A|nr:signal recognition particle 19 kDa protein [Falco naumanni]